MELRSSIALKAFITVVCMTVTECDDELGFLWERSAMYLSNEHGRGKTPDQTLPVLPEAKIRNKTTQRP